MESSELFILVCFDVDLASWETGLLRVQQYERTRTMILRGLNMRTCTVKFKERASQQLARFCRIVGSMKNYELELQFDDTVRVADSFALFRACLSLFFLLFSLLHSLRFLFSVLFVPSV